ncbi:MAG TPA: VTT domain-containing protein [Acidobacteriaceae bacterium]|nr:VTT domain-containing protein [Acidobacteriaceae bacterium]
MKLAPQPIAVFLAASANHTMMHAFYHLGLAGLVLISTVDSSFVPLPIPGVTDILIILYAANHANLFLLVFLATIGSALGGFLSHWAGQVGGMAFLEKHVSPRYLKPIQHWVESHSILSVALPAILPPPMPLSPFVLVAGAVKMNRRKFMTAFTISRFARHVLAAWLGVHYGKAVLHLWNEFSARWAVTILVVFWSVTIIFTAIGIWKLVQTSRSMKLRPNAAPAQPTTP